MVREDKCWNKADGVVITMSGLALSIGLHKQER